MAAALPYGRDMRILIGLSLLAAAPAAAEGRYTVWGGGGAWNESEHPAHGALVVAYDTALGGGHLGLEYNTETLRATYDAIRLGPDVEASLGAAGEAFLAGVSRDYYRDGHDDDTRGYFAHYALLHAGLKFRIGERAYMEAALDGRRWFFDETSATASDFTLTAGTWTLEPRLRYTWWGLEDDAAWHERQRPFPRVRGLAAGLELGVDGRGETRRWGAADDPRNRPGTVIFRPRQWLLAGWQFLPYARMQIQENAAGGVGEDDLTRDKIGGLTPYSVPLAGAPWTGWLSERYVAGQWSGHLRAWHELEVGPLVDAVVLEDPHRTGEHDAGFEWGVGALADLRLQAWQIDLRGGWSPTLSDESGRTAFTVWLSAGWSWGPG
jgi:hypothetical protein